MALLSPFRTDTFIAYRDDDLRTSHVSVALWFVDAFTGRKPISDVSVQLRGSAQRAIRNPSGYYCFTDLAPGKYTLDLVFNFVRSDYYLNDKIEVEIPLPNALEPVLEIHITPKVAYPFPAHTTLIRGRVFRFVNQKEDPVPHATVYRVEAENTKSLHTKTDQNGEYVLYINKFEKKDDDLDEMEVIIGAEKDGQEGENRRLIRESEEGSTFIMNVDLSASQ